MLSRLRVVGPGLVKQRNWIRDVNGRERGFADVRELI